MIEVSTLGYIATFLSLLGNAFIVMKKRTGFVVWTAGNVVWIWLDLIIKLYSQIVMMLFYTLFNIWGYHEWSRPPRRGRYLGLPVYSYEEYLHETFVTKKRR